MKKVFMLLAGAVMAATAAAAPNPVTAAYFYSGINGVSMTVFGNGSNDVVVLYNTYCDRGTTEDHGLFATPAANAQVGDVLNVPAGYTPMFDFAGAPAPANAGTVGYVGRIGTSQYVDINGLEPNTQYYLAIYTRDSQGVYSEPFYIATSTCLQCPWAGDSFNYPRFSLPGEWYSDSATSFTDRMFWDNATKTVTRGTQPIQQVATIDTPNTTDGVEVTLELPSLNINNEKMAVTFEYCIAAGEGASATAYNTWADDDVLAIQVSEDGRSTWTDAAKYTATTRPSQDGALTYVTITADMSAYFEADKTDKIVTMQLYWKTFMATPASMYINRISISEAETPVTPVDPPVVEPTIPEVPGGLTFDMGEEDKVLLVWDRVDDAVSYDVAYKLKDAAEWTEKNTTETIIALMIADLTEGGEYVWKVRANGEGDTHSDYSEEATFTVPSSQNVGVAAVGAEASEGVYYDLQGRRMANPEGICIRDGKKVIVK